MLGLAFALAWIVGGVGCRQSEVSSELRNVGEASIAENLDQTRMPSKAEASLRKIWSFGDSESELPDAAIINPQASREIPPLPSTAASNAMFIVPNDQLPQAIPIAYTQAVSSPPKSLEIGSWPAQPQPAQVQTAENMQLDENFRGSGTFLATPDNEQLHLKMSAANQDGKIDLHSDNETISLTAQDALLSSVISMLAEQMNLNLVTSQMGDERINVALTNVTLQDAMELVLPLHGYTFIVQSNVLIVSKMSKDQSIHPSLQGKEIRVFDLNYTSGVEVLRVVSNLLSPVGSAYINEARPDNTRQTHEQIIVEDVPTYMYRIQDYLAQCDTPPRQVRVEAHILQVTLRDNCRHGVDFDQLLRMANSNVQLQSTGFLSNSTPATLLRINGTDLTSVVDLLKSTTDAKTLASPKVTVLNGQKSRMQVGGEIGYLLTTTTQTSSLQSVNFLEFGVILTVTPVITQEGNILMQVLPQVSTGRINAATNLPESETTEIETTVMLRDGEAMILGGLIKETDTESQSKVPILGDMWMIGRLFQRRSVLLERNEVIITLLPRIVSECGPLDGQEQCQIDQGTTPLMHGPLLRNNRTQWEPQLPDASRR